MILMMIDFRLPGKIICQLLIQLRPPSQHHATYSPYMLTWNNPVDSYFSFHLSAHRNSEDAICSPSRSCSDEGLKCTEGVKQRKINIKKLTRILTLALRIDNPSNGFESTFLETYDPPIQFHR